MGLEGDILFLEIVIFCLGGAAKLRCAGNIIFFKVPRSPFIRDRDIEGGEIEEGGCE